MDSHLMLFNAVWGNRICLVITIYMFGVLKFPRNVIHWSDCYAGRIKQRCNSRQTMHFIECSTVQKIFKFPPSEDRRVICCIESVLIQCNVADASILYSRTRIQLPDRWFIIIKFSSKLKGQMERRSERWKNNIRFNDRLKRRVSRPWKVLHE